MIAFHQHAETLLHPLDDITPHIRNPVNDDVEEIIAHVQRVGVYNPIVVSRRTKEILGNYGLYEALLALGETHGPVLWVDDDNEEEAVVIMLGLYAIPAMAWIDPGLEIPLLKELLETERGLIGTGFPEEILANRLAELEEDSMGFEGAALIQCPNCHHRFESDVR